MMDLTTLEGADTPARVRQMCRKAMQPAAPALTEALQKVEGFRPIPPVAAVCVYPLLVPHAVKALEGSGVHVASVATAFPLLGGLVPNWFHEFVGSTLHEHPEALEFNIIPLLTSLVVALGGLGLGWLVYRNVNSPAEDKLQIGLLKNKYYFDEIYDVVFVKPAYWRERGYPPHCRAVGAKEFTCD